MSVRAPSLDVGVQEHDADYARPQSSGTLERAASNDVEKRALRGKEDVIVSDVVCDPYAPTDGGFYAWKSVVGSFLISFSAFGIVSSYGAFSDFYNTEYLSHFSPTIISMIGAIQIFVFYLFSGLAGTLFDAYGPRVLIPVSGIVSAFAMFMLSITKPEHIYQQFLSQGILYPIGASFGFFPAANVITHWFRRRVAYALGCVIAGSGVGGIVFPILLTRLIPRIGFGWTVRVVAFIMLFCYFIASFAITARRPPKPLPSLIKLIDLDGFRDARYTFLVVASVLNTVTIFNPYFYVGLYGLTLHPGSTLLPYALFNVITIFTLITAILNLALWYNATGEGVIIAFAGLYGFFSGAYFSIISACVTMVSPIDKIGARMGTLFMCVSFGSLAGTPIAGVFIKDRTRGNFQHLIAF
ncbi:hypothetical protein EW146_g799 [Bondarzewia mesenterica]|uniref:Major facilitator superfamily (MFS) profile domain-containing protein n=1 Tax=Bondarzewia mesenterica TaxID=1095465 RepID=A0A4S4M7R4_9AGAM|nr:hypothetical protein EW146_g799 [Bondarzewia mesenterica]